MNFLLLLFISSSMGYAVPSAFDSRVKAFLAKVRSILELAPLIFDDFKYEQTKKPQQVTFKPDQAQKIKYFWST